MSRRRYLEWKKERLIRQIQQQRLDLAEHKSLWLEKPNALTAAGRPFLACAAIWYSVPASWRCTASATPAR